MKYPTNSPVNDLSLKHHRPPQPVPPLQPHHLPGERWRFATKHKDTGCTRIVMTNCHLNDVLTLQISQLRNTFPSSNTPFSPLQLPRHRARHGSRSRTLGHGCSTLFWGLSIIDGMNQLQPDWVESCCFFVAIHVIQLTIFKVSLIVFLDGCLLKSLDMKIIKYTWMQKHWEHQSSSSKCIIVVL